MILVPSGEDAPELLIEDIALRVPADAKVGDHARVLQLNRPRKRNALTTSLLGELGTEIDRASADPLIRAIVVCGSGGTFCAGGDVKEFDGSESSREGVMTRSALLLEVAEKLEHAPVPTLAVVVGPAVGGGAVLALACDMIIAAPDIRLGFPELKSSVVPSLVMPSALAEFGRRGAFDLLTSGRLLEAHELLGRGVVHRTADPEDLRRVTAEVLDGWAAVPNGLLAATKQLLTTMAGMSPTEAVRAGLDATAELWTPRSS